MNEEQNITEASEPGVDLELSDCQQRAEKLAFENKMLRAVLDSMPDNISIKDLQGRYIFDNSSHCRFLGATNTVEVVGKTLFDFLPPTIAAKFHAEDLRVLQSAAVVQSVDEAVDAAGNRVWMSVTKMPLRDDAGKLVGLVSTTRDVTARKQAEEQLAAYSEALREKNAQLEADLETARELQHALLPQQYPRFPSSASPEASALRFHHFLRVSSGVGGDFFDVFQISDSLAGVLICDVMGHGVGAALVAAILRAFVEDFRPYATDPARFLQELNQGLARLLRHSRLTMFVSAFYALADIARGELQYAKAGHPAPLCLHRPPRAAERLSLSAFKSDPVLGIFEGVQYHSSSCELTAGDILLLFTDGLFEVEGIDRQFYDQARLLKAVSQRVGLCAEELCQQLVEEVQQFAATKEFADDVCLVAMEIDHLV
jgi:sigma-B regulation protein RsbU (phosphoserine phosphatase)